MTRVSPYTDLAKGARYERAAAQACASPATFPASALEAARKAGRTVKSAVVEHDRVVLTFDDDASVKSGTNEWDEAIAS